jgi:hypothetical protein
MNNYEDCMNENDMLVEIVAEDIENLCLSAVIDAAGRWLSLEYQKRGPEFIRNTYKERAIAMRESMRSH